MTRKALRDAILRAVYVEDPSTPPDYVLDDVAIAVNQALQLLWSLPGLEYFRKQEIEVELVAGTRRYALDASVQSVLGEARLGGSALRPVRTKGDIEHYAVRFLGATSEATGTPEAYWVEEIAAGSGADASAIYVWLAPTPSANGTLTLEASTQAPNYTAAELDDASSTIPVPHGYAESLLLPVARFMATRGHWFTDEEGRATKFETDANNAFATLGLVSPWPKPRPAPREAAA